MDFYVLGVNGHDDRTGGSGAAESLNTAAPAADASQHPLLTAPQHA